MAIDPSPLLSRGPATLLAAVAAACAPEAAPGGAWAGAGTAPVLFDDEHALVIPMSGGLGLLDAAGQLRTFDWPALIGPCSDCDGQGASPDGDGLLLSWAIGQGPGGVAALRGDGTLAWRIDGLSFPHDAVRDPTDSSVVIAEAGADRLVWVSPERNADAPLTPERTLGPMPIPNGLMRLDPPYDDRMLISTRGEPGRNGGIVLLSLDGGPKGDGRAVPRWVFLPESGLDVPHSPVLRQIDADPAGRWWLAWAHTAGAPGTGTIGLAVTDAPDTAPRYVADLVPRGFIAPFGLVRGVELTSDGWLLITDSGGASGGRVLRAPLPVDLEPAAAGERVYVDLEGATMLARDLPRPFEGWLWKGYAL